MAFTTVTGSDGITSLVGTTGVDTATIVTLNDKVFVGGNTGNDTLVTALGTGSSNVSDYNVRMGGGDDGVVLTDNLLNSFISLDGETLANDGDDTYTGAGTTTVNSEVVGRGGNDAFTLGSIQSSLFNGNSGIDNFTSGNVAGTEAGVTLSNATILGGQGSDVFAIGFGADGEIRGSGNNINGNRGDDQIVVEGTTLASTTLFGGQGADTIALSSTIDGNTLSGDLGNDDLLGSASDDILLGGDGADTLEGAVGADTLTGGIGVNTYEYDGTGQSSISGNSGFDVITDLKSGAADTGDIIDFGSDNAVTVLAGTIAADSTDLESSLEATLAGLDYDATGGGTGMLANTVYTVNITAPVSFAGSYIVAQDNLAAGAFAAATTNVIQANTVAGLAANNFS